MLTIGNSICRMAFPDLETRRLRLRQVCRTEVIALCRKMIGVPQLALLICNEVLSATTVSLSPKEVAEVIGEPKSTVAAMIDRTAFRAAKN
jgi:hypothetical protein